MTIHPARATEFGEFYGALLRAKEQKLVTETESADGLRLYCYSDACVYDRQWDDVTLAARGLIIDPRGGRVVATPFPKFFNVGERADPIPDLSFETFEKLDGSLIILFHHAGEWRAATKGSFASAQAAWAKAYIDSRDLSALTPGTTYLAEYIGPENRIVVHYREAGLVMLGAYTEGGAELSYDSVRETALRLGWPTAARHSWDAVSDLIVHAKGLPASEEGFVLRFANGHRLKVKGDEYRRIHALISRLTPLAIWEAMEARDDLDKVRRDLPEEFWADFDQITGLLNGHVTALVSEVTREAGAVAELSDKEVGLRLASFPDPVRGLIFPYRRNGGDLLSGKSRRAVFRSIRPTANRLKGYAPSYAINRVMEEAS